MHHAAIEEKLKEDYRGIATQYRSDDETEILTENHRRLGNLLKQVCQSLKGPLTVLDVGCGTGRYFHCLENVATLVGMDLSADMLAAARNPVCREGITAKQIQLRSGNIYQASFAPESFDFIYSLGMFGHGAPVTQRLCNNFYKWLRPRGKLFFDVVDVAGLPLARRTRWRLRQAIYPILPRSLQQALTARQNGSSFFGLNHRQLEAIMERTPFTKLSVASHRCESPLWSGRHLECLAQKI